MTEWHQAIARCPVCSRRFVTRDDRGCGGRVQLYRRPRCTHRAKYLRRRGLPLTGQWTPRGYSTRTPQREAV